MKLKHTQKSICKCCLSVNGESIKYKANYKMTTMESTNRITLHRKLYFCKVSNPTKCIYFDRVKTPFP